MKLKIARTETEKGFFNCPKCSGKVEVTKTDPEGDYKLNNVWCGGCKSIIFVKD